MATDGVPRRAPIMSIQRTFQLLALRGSAGNCHRRSAPHVKKKIPGTPRSVDPSESRAAKSDLRRIQACETEACEAWLRAVWTGHSGESRSARSLDQRGWHVYSPIIRTGHSPPSQLSTLDPVVAGKGFF